jgi:hypothetical protein
MRAPIVRPAALCYIGDEPIEKGVVWMKGMQIAFDGVSVV